MTDMTENRYIAAIEISSSKIIGAVGKINANKEIQIIAVEQENVQDSVRWGLIRNLEDTAMRISRIISRLERKPAVAPRKIKSVFVGLSGRSLRSIETEVEMMLPEETEIDDTILSRLRDMALHTAIDNSLEVVDAVPCMYVVDKSETHSPKGMLGSKISAVYNIIVCRPDLKRNIERTIAEKLKLKIEGMIVTSLAASKLVLSPEERRLGCMLVDFGAETTAVNIFKGGNMVYFATIPMGSRLITRDITSLSFLEERAEEIKRQSGKATPTESSSLNLNGVKMSKISSVIVARCEEIAANVIEQPVYAGLKESDLPEGMVCIGGGFELNGMIDLMSNYMPARRGQIPAFIRIEESRVPSAMMVQVAAILNAGATATEANCLEIPERHELPVTGEENPEEQPQEEQKPVKEKAPKKPGWFKTTLTNWFRVPDDEGDSDIE